MFEIWVELLLEIDISEANSIETISLLAMIDPL